MQTSQTKLNHPTATCNGRQCKHCYVSLMTQIYRMEDSERRDRTKRTEMSLVFGDDPDWYGMLSERAEIHGNVHGGVQ